MGHAAGKDIYRELGLKIDNLTFRAPWNETFHTLLKEQQRTPLAPYFFSMADTCEKAGSSAIVEF